MARGVALWYLLAMTVALSFVFFCSGAAALVYQIVWQRVLFATYGLDITSVTVVVSAFMLGLGFGSLLGGALSRAVPRAAISLFAIAEFGIGVFGYFSIDLFGAVASVTAGIGYFATGIVSFLLVVVPTMLMGATLPLLVGYATSLSGNVGRSVGTLYFANTLGGAVGAYLTAQYLFRLTGLSGAVEAMAAVNIALGVVVFALGKVARRVQNGGAAA